MKQPLLFLGLFFLSLTGFSQQPGAGTLQGTLRMADGQPAAFASVQLRGTRLGTTANEAGDYALNNVPAGEYTLLVSGVGVETLRQAVTVAAGEVTKLDVTLRGMATQLQAVEVTGRRETSYKNDYSYALKTQSPIKDIPQSIVSVTKELMQDQQSFRTGDVVKNISGVNQFSAYDDFTLRGFRSNTQLINGLRAGSGFWSQPLLVNIERVEVIKGPAGALFGRTDPGGTINRVTKKPLPYRRNAVSFTTGSFETYRATLDFTGPANESGTLLYRLNVGYESTETFKTLQNSEDFVVSPSLSFVPNDKTQINLDLVYATTDGKLYRGQPIFGATAGTNLNSTPISFAIGRANDYLKERNFFTTVSLNHKFSSSLSFNVSYLKFFYRENLMEHRTSNSYAVDGAGKQIPTLMQMQTIRRLSRNYADNVTAYFVKTFGTGPLRHQVLLGYDYARNYVPIGGSSEQARGYRLKSGGIANTFNPARAADYVLDAKGNPVPNVPHFDLVKPDYSIANVSGYVTTATAMPEALATSGGVYLQDQIDYKKLSVLLGLRKEFFNDRFNYRTATEQSVKQESLLPRLGLVYRLTPATNLYATYVRGFVPQNTASLANPNVGGPFDPLSSRMMEAGVKSELFGKRLLLTTSVYQVEQNNVLVNANNPQNPELLQQRGQERGRGVELDASGKVTEDFSINVNYAYARTLITQDNNEARVGRIKENAPVHQGGVWMRYNLSKGELKGLGLGLGSNFVSERNTFSDILKLPAYTLFDAAVYYRFSQYQVAVNFNNLTNQTHWVGGYDFNRLFPGAPRNFLATLSCTF